jgi:hypothetical protein
MQSTNTAGQVGQAEGRAGAAPAVHAQRARLDGRVWRDVGSVEENAESVAV